MYNDFTSHSNYYCSNDKININNTHTLLSFNPITTNTANTSAPGGVSIYPPSSCTATTGTATVTTSSTPITEVLMSAAGSYASSSAITHINNITNNNTKINNTINSNINSHNNNNNNLNSVKEQSDASLSQIHNYDQYISNQNNVQNFLV